MFGKKKIAALTFAVMLGLSSSVYAANVTSARYHSGSEHDRIVFDLSSMPNYTVSSDDNGRELIIDFEDSKAKVKDLGSFKSSRIESVSYASGHGHVIVHMRLKSGLTYRVGKLGNPSRVYVDILPQSGASSYGRTTTGGTNTGKTTTTTTKPSVSSADLKNITPLSFDGLDTEAVAPGLVKRKYIYWDNAGQITAYFIEADHNLYKIKPALARGQVPGLETTSGIARDNNALAAVNATYFAWTGDMIGIVKIDGQVAGTTYIPRTALGIKKDGTPFMGVVSYSGMVKLGDVTQPVSGVDAERGSDNLTIYNKWYGSHTRTNEYGQEYTVRNGRVTSIQTGNSAIPSDGEVISVHGTAADAFAGVQVGDPAVINEDLGTQWNNAVDIMGAGPRLVENGVVNVTVDAEQFPSDIRDGRAPRSAVAILNNGNYLFGVVDGRQSSSRGLTLYAWANLLKKFGARDAMNLDGGGSSDLVVDGQVQNNPSDGQERTVGSALVLLKK